MKLQLFTTSLLLAATVCTSALATEENEIIRLTAQPYIECGMTRETVLAMFGGPSARLSADVWVYYDFKAVNPIARRAQSVPAADKRDALIVGFKDDRVNLIRACDSQPVRAFIAQQESRKLPAPTVAAK